MRFLLYCPIASSSLSSLLGTQDYSYRFVLEGFRSALQCLGEVIEIHSPYDEAPRLRAEAVAAGYECRLLCFCPPNRAPVGLDCPTTVVLAWEFDTIPSLAWGNDPRNDWRTVLRNHGQAITLSTHTRDTILREMHDEVVVTAIPVPVYEHFSAASARVAGGAIPPTTVSFSGGFIDSCAVDFDAGTANLTNSLSFPTQQWDGGQLNMRFGDAGEGTNYLLGFYESEPWGTWSRVAEPALLLPYAIYGRVKVSIRLRAYGANVGRNIQLGFGSERLTITLTDRPATHTFKVNIRKPVNLISFGTLDLSPVSGSADKRTMGIGLVSLKVSPKNRRWWNRSSRLPVSPLPVVRAEPVLSGVVFTAVLNPRDGRKNWIDILTAFCYALGDCKAATLVIKFTHFSAASFLSELLTKLAEIGPIQARVLALHGFLSDHEYRRLINATSWYVNASHGEGLCLPLMEFMSSGVPAIAPSHTAMTDYVDESSTLVLRSSRMPTCWPNDPLRRLRTRYYSIDWESLATCFSEAFTIAIHEPDRYRAMAEAAVARQRDYAGLERVTTLLQGHLERKA